MGINLSYSAVDTYLSCSEKFRLQRIEKVLPVTIATPLFFGKAFDNASEVIFKDKMVGEDRVPFDRDKMLEVLKQNLTIINHSGLDLNVRKEPNVNYSKADVNFDIYEDEDIKEIEAFLEEKDIELEGGIKGFIEYYQSKYNTKAKVIPPSDVKEVYNFIAWFSLYRLGIYMLDALKKWSDENIKEVKSIQRFFQIKNDEGDEFRGLIDLEAVLYSSPDRVTTIDLKSARNPLRDYPDDVIQTAMQLHIYSEVSNPDVGYVVVGKEVKKREPRVQIREVYGTVSDEQKDAVFERIDTALQGVKAGIFEPNKDACYKFGLCEYFKLCHYNDRTGLIKREEWDKIVEEKKSIDNIDIKGMIESSGQKGE